MMKKRQRPITARNACDRLFSQIIRADGTCESCGTTENIQCAHIIRRGYTATRTDTANALPLCAKCHIHFTHEPDEWVSWLVAEIGGDEYARLKVKALAGVGIKFDWFAERERLMALHAEVFLR